MENSILFETFKRSQENKEIIGIWSYNDDDGFWAGYIKEFNERIIKLQHFTKYGKPDGVIIESIEDIKNVDFDDDYSKALQYVVDHSDELDKEEDFELDINNEDEWQLGILKQVVGKACVVRLEVNNTDYYSGYITRLSESDLVLHCVGKMGEDEGPVVYKIEDITCIRVNDMENRKKHMLFQWRETQRA